MHSDLRVLIIPQDEMIGKLIEQRSPQDNGYLRLIFRPRIPHGHGPPVKTGGPFYGRETVAIIRTYTTVSAGQYSLTGPAG